MEDNCIKFPAVLERPGGLIGDIMAYTIEQAHRPNVPLAFAGALSLVAHLGARRFRTSGNGRPNLYTLALAWSGSGKSAPRKSNIDILKACGMGRTAIEAFRSGEALQDSLLKSPRLLSQFDEVDALFDMIKKSRDSLGTNLMSEMLAVWEKSGSYMRRRQLAASGKAKVKDDTPEFVNHPHFTFFGTGVTSEVYHSISDKMAKNGFFARLIVIDGGKRGAENIVAYMPPPDSVISRCEILCGRSGMDANVKQDEDNPEWDGTGRIVPTTADAVEFRREISADAELRYNNDEDGPHNAIWNRTVEKCEKAALVFAMSDDPKSPTISRRHWEMAKELVYYSNMQQLVMLSKYSAEDDYQDVQKRILRKLGKGRTCDRDILRFSHMKRQDLIEVLDTLRAGGQIIYCNKQGEEYPADKIITPKERTVLYYELP